MYLSHPKKHVAETLDSIASLVYQICSFACFVALSVMYICLVSQCLSIVQVTSCLAVLLLLTFVCVLASLTFRIAAVLANITYSFQYPTIDDDPSN